MTVAGVALGPPSRPDVPPPPFTMVPPSSVPVHSFGSNRDSDVLTSTYRALVNPTPHPSDDSVSYNRRPVVVSHFLCPVLSLEPFLPVTEMTRLFYSVSLSLLLSLPPSISESLSVSLSRTRVGRVRRPRGGGRGPRCGNVTERVRWERTSERKSEEKW